jgi:putative aldouronate transport system substrate-binding protein
MKRTRRSFVSFAAVLLVVLQIAGCSGSKSSSGSSASPQETAAAASSSPAGDQFKLGSKPLTFSFYGNYDWYTMPAWGKDTATKWIQDNMKVTVNGIQSAGNAAQKLSSMIASKNLPDVVWLDRGADVEKLAQAGVLVPLDDYINKYPNLKKWLGPAALNMLRSSDGKIYQFPNWYTQRPNGNSGYAVNKKIYEELGSPKLETTDDMYNFLKAVKAKYPDVIPIEPGLAPNGDGLDVMYAAFAEGRTPADIANGVVKDNQFSSLFTDPVFREAMQYQNKLFREKLMDQDTMTQTNDQLIEKVVGSRVAVYVSSSPTTIVSKVSDVNSKYMMVWPVHKEGLNKDKVYTGTFSQLGWNVSVITQAAKDPEAIFAYFDWLTGPEGERIIFWGPEGLYWQGTDDKDAPKFTEKFTSDAEGRNKLMSATNDFQWAGNTVYIDTSKEKYQMTLPEEERDWATRYQSAITWKTQKDATEFVNLSPMPDSPEGITEQTMKDLLKETRAKALFAKSDAEVLSVLDDAETKAQQAGYSKLLEFRTKQWQENLKKMQTK